MQPGYRGYQGQQPQRSPHPPPSSRRGIGPMISGGAHPQSSLTPAQMAQQQQQAQIQSERAKMRSRKPTDKNMPEGVEDCIIGDGVQRYRELRDVERRLDGTMARKRLDIQDAVNRNLKRYRTLRLWISNTVEDQPWQADGLDADAFDFSTNVDSSYRVKIEGRLLDEEKEEEDDDDMEVFNGDAMDEDGKEESTVAPKKDHKLSHFFKAMTVDYGRTKAKDGSDLSVEWKKPALPNKTAIDLPEAADFDVLEFKRSGDENTNITINLVRDEEEEVYLYRKPLADLLDTPQGTRGEAVLGIWEYIKLMKLQGEDEKRAFECDELLQSVVQREKSYIPFLPEIVNLNILPQPPLKLQYTIRVDKEFHDNPEPTIYDIRVRVEDPLKAALQTYLVNPSYAQDLRDLVGKEDQLAILVQKIANSKSKHAFFEALAKNPTEFILRWLSSQKRDLEIMAGEAVRGGGEDASGDEWRRGGKNSIWGSENVRESVNLIVSQRAKV